VKNFGKPSARDLEATDALIKLVGSDRFKFLLKDKTSKKKKRLGTNCQRNDGSGL